MNLGATMAEEQVQPLAVLSSPVRRSIMDALARLPHLVRPGEPSRVTGLTAADLAETLHLHVTTVRFHLERLEQAGLVTAHDERNGVGRPRRRFTVHPGQLAEASAPEAYRLLAEVLADAMARGDAPGAVEAGRRWAIENAFQLIGYEATPETSLPARTPGAWLGKVGAVLDVLDRWGYEPSISTTQTGTTQLDIHHCPVVQLVLDNPAVACGVHQGVIEGTLEALGEPDAGVSLTPFVDERRCVAELCPSRSFPERLPAPRLLDHPVRPTERPAR